MKQYKGVYIDGAIFHNTAEVDSFLKMKAVEAYNVAVEVYCMRRTPEAAALVGRKAEYLVDQFGMDWEELDAIEAEVMKATA